MLGEVAGAVVHGGVVGQLSPAAARQDVPARSGDRLAQVAAAEGAGVAAVEDEDDVVRPGGVRELVDPDVADRRREQVGGLGVLHAQVQAAALVELAVPAEVHEQHVVAIGTGEELPERPDRPRRGRLRQQGDVGVREQPGVLVDERAIDRGDVLDRAPELLQVVLVGGVGRVPDQEGAVSADHVGPPTRAAAARAISFTVAVSTLSPLNVTCRSMPSSSQRTSMLRFLSRCNQARKHSTAAVSAPELPRARITSSIVPLVPGEERPRWYVSTCAASSRWNVPTCARHRSSAAS
jgi:hypothetical protein